ncbi:MAG TPA: insulinase family protein, partial [Planctomycetota bacterium]|nr:insulinase family protein [Planctomycetota bacterium]
ADLARLPSGVVQPLPAPQPPAIRGRSVTIVEKPSTDPKPGEEPKTTSAAISFGYPISVKRGTRDYYALWIANSWLGEHRNSSSHLYQVIREARGMNYGDYSYIEAYPNGGARTKPPTGVGRRGQMFEVWIRPVKRQEAVFALRAALREVELLSKQGLTKEQFDATKAFLSKYSLHFAETTAERLGYALDDRYFDVAGEGHLALFRKMMKEITLEEVNAAVKKHLQVDDVQIAIVSDHALELRDAIAADKPSPITYDHDVSPEVLEQDKQIERYPLHVPMERVSILPVADAFSGKEKLNW